MSIKYSIVTMAVLSIAMSGCGQESQDAAQATKDAVHTTAVQTERQLEKAGVVLDDAAITTKVKATLFMAPDLKGLAINVDTMHNVVTLSGTVESQDLRQQAEAMANGIHGVKDVKNDLMVKQP